MKKRELMELLHFEHEANAALVGLNIRLQEYVDELEAEVKGEGVPRMKEVIFNGPATVVKYEDGTKTIAKCGKHDKFDALFGLMACIVRKIDTVDENPVHECEDALHEMAGNIKSEADLEHLLAFATLMRDVLFVLQENKDVWLPHLGAPAVVVTDEPVTATKVPVVHIDLSGEAYKFAEEAARQIVRNLIDEGEL